MSKPDEFDMGGLETLDLEGAEKAAEEKAAGGGEALTDAEADCEGCKI